MVTTNQKHTMDTKNLEVKENKHIIKGNHQTKRQEKITKKIIENYKNNQKTINNKQQNGNNQIFINNHFKCQWTK